MPEEVKIKGMEEQPFLRCDYDGRWIQTIQTADEAMTCLLLGMHVVGVDGRVLKIDYDKRGDISCLNYS